MEEEKHVRIIPARKKKGNKAAEIEVNKLRVAAYCRVSTDSDEQAMSYDAQVDHYTEYIKQNPTWEFAGVYADDGISGTDTRKREEFNRLMDDCMSGKIDMIITKSISRFARNTLDCLKHIRKLKGMNIPVIFEKEGINTMDAKGEVMLTIMASLAQQESESLSKNVKMGLQFRYQKGKVQVNTNWFLGYTKDEKGNLVIDPEQAEIVKRIFREFLAGKSCQQIADGLQADGIRNGAGRTKWWASNITRILQNEKYIGDALLQKTYTEDVLTKKRVVNDGTVPQYYVEKDHPAIVSKEAFYEARAELERRRVLSQEVGKAYCSIYALTGTLICGNCGAPFRRVVWTNRGKKVVVWRCRSRMDKKGCMANTVYEKDLHEAVVRAFRQVQGSDKPIIQTLRKNSISVIREEGDVKVLDGKMKDLQKELVKRVNHGEDYSDLSEKIRKLQEERERAIEAQVQEEEKEKRIRDLTEFLKKDIDLEYSDSLVREYIEKIEAFDGKFVLTFKTGTQVEV